MQTHLCTHITKTASERWRERYVRERCILHTWINNPLFMGATSSEHQHKHSSNPILPHCNLGSITDTYCQFFALWDRRHPRSTRQNTRIHLSRRSILETLLKLWSKLLTLCTLPSKAYTVRSERPEIEQQWQLWLKFKIMQCTSDLTGSNPFCSQVRYQKKQFRFENTYLSCQFSHEYILDCLLSFAFWQPVYSHDSYLSL